MPRKRSNSLCKERKKVRAPSPPKSCFAAFFLSFSTREERPPNGGRKPDGRCMNTRGLPEDEEDVAAIAKDARIFQRPRIAPTSGKVSLSAGRTRYRGFLLSAVDRTTCHIHPDHEGRRPRRNNKPGKTPIGKKSRRKNYSKHFSPTSKVPKEIEANRREEKKETRRVRSRRGKKKKQ